MLLMPPKITMPVNTVKITPVIHGSILKLLLIDIATEFDCTELPMPKEAMVPKSANSKAIHFIFRPRSM